jgi:hypothetical protein
MTSSDRVAPAHAWRWFVLKAARHAPRGPEWKHLNARFFAVLGAMGTAADDDGTGIKLSTASYMSVARCDDETVTRILNAICAMNLAVKTKSARGGRTPAPAEYALMFPIGADAKTGAGLDWDRALFVLKSGRTRRKRGSEPAEPGARGDVNAEMVTPPAEPGARGDVNPVRTQRARGTEPPREISEPRARTIQNPARALSEPSARGDNQEDQASQPRVDGSFSKSPDTHAETDQPLRGIKDFQRERQQNRGLTSLERKARALAIHHEDCDLYRDGDPCGTCARLHTTWQREMHGNPFAAIPPALTAAAHGAPRT